MRIFSDVKDTVLGMTRFAGAHPRTFFLLLMGYAVKAANDVGPCYFVYCAYKGGAELLSSSLSPLPTNLTQYCENIDPITPKSPVIGSGSLFVGSLCNFTCRPMAHTGLDQPVEAAYFRPCH